MVQAGKTVASELAYTVYKISVMAAVVIVSAGDEQSGLIIN